MYINAEKRKKGNECLFKTFLVSGEFLQTSQFLLGIICFFKKQLQNMFAAWSPPLHQVNLSYLKVKIWQSKLRKRQRDKGANNRKKRTYWNTKTGMTLKRKSRGQWQNTYPLKNKSVWCNCLFLSGLSFFPRKSFHLTPWSRGMQRKRRLMCSVGSC